MSSTFSRSVDDGVIYFNASLTNAIGSETPPILAKFDKNMNTSIVDNAKEYNLAITRFSVSTSSIPFFICPAQLGQADVNLTPYTFFGIWNSVPTSTHNVIFIPQDQFANVPTSPLVRQDFSTGYYNVYTSQYFLNLVNNALRRVCQDLYTAGAPVPDPSADLLNSIYIRYNDSTTLFELVAPPEYDLTNGSNTPRIYINEALNLLLGLQLAAVGKAFEPYSKWDSLLSISSEFYGGQTITVKGDKVRIMMPGDHRALDVWSPLSRIVVTSTTLKTQQEYLQPGVNYGTLLTPSQNSDTSNIITDFEPDYYNNPIVDRNFIQYGVTGVANYRLIEFNVVGYSELRNFNIQFWWMDDYGNTYPLYLNTGCGLNVKFAFVPKNMFITS